jgi:hypothetical protein
MTAYSAGALSNLPPCITVTTHWFIIFSASCHILYVVQLSSGTSHIRIRSSTSFDICPSVLQTAPRSSDAIMSRLCFLTRIPGLRIKMCKVACCLSRFCPFRLSYYTSSRMLSHHMHHMLLSVRMPLQRLALIAQLLVFSASSNSPCVKLHYVACTKAARTK